MKKKIVYSFCIVLGFMSAIFLFSAASRNSTPSQSEPSKETMEECCKKEKDTDGGNPLDFESLPGKFFSTMLIN